MDTLDKLKSGALVGTTKIKLSLGLTHFPDALFTLENTLEVLDMTDNQLSTLPAGFSRFKKLKILFLSNNAFTEVPSILSQCENLSMLGMRNCNISSLKENVLPLTIKWLILTDNMLKALPNSIGKLKMLQKCMLSGNKLESLPQTMVHCKNLELLRISANQLTELPMWITTLPKLSWLSYAGNPFCKKHPHSQKILEKVSWKTLTIKETLGEGASGHILKASYKGNVVAIKIFKAKMTSDGLPQEEIDINIAIGKHKHLINVLACVTDHPEGKEVLMLELIPPTFFNLGLPPTFKSCTRDVYPDGFSLSFSHLLRILKEMSNAAMHMHSKNIIHGDFYAHNILIDKEGNSILSDFGGASYYEPKETQKAYALEQLEVRAFGCLIEELLYLSKNISSTKEGKAIKQLYHIKNKCLTEETQKRPSFKQIHKTLTQIMI